MATDAEIIDRVKQIAEKSKELHAARNALLKDFRLALKDCEQLEGLVATDDQRDEDGEALNQDHELTQPIANISYFFGGHVGPGYFQGVENDWSEPLEFWIPSHC